MTDAFAVRSGRLIAVATTAMLLAGMLVVTTSADARGDDEDQLVDTASGLSLSITATPSDGFEEGDAVVVTYTATNTSAAPLDVPADATVVNRISRSETTLSGDCAASGSEVSGEWDVFDAQIALPDSVLPGETFTCTQSFTTRAADLTLGGIWTQMFFAAEAHPQHPSGEFIAHLLASVDSLSEPTVSGDARVGSTLFAQPGFFGLWSDEHDYQWLRDGTAITGATAASYALEATDIGAGISVRITGRATNADGSTLTLVSAATAQVAAGALTAGAPTISGSAKVGQNLAVATGAWSPGTVAFTYQWLRDGAVITGATASDYTVAAADLGKRISARVTGDEPGYAARTETTAPTAIVVAGSMSTATPTLSGTVAVAATLTVKPGVWSSGVALRYQWLRNGVKIVGATAATYKLTSSDAGKQISITVTGVKAGFTTVGKTSAKSTKVLVAGAPAITGTRKVGSALSVSKGTWTKSVTFGYQWLRDGAKIPGATGAAYRLTAADAGKKITLTLTGRLSGYATVSKTTAATGSISRGTLVAAAPKITGTAKVSGKLIAKVGTWTSGTTMKYQWYRNGAAIPGATSSTYTLRPTDAYARITVKTTGTKSGYVTTVKASSATASVAGKVYANCARLNADYPDGVRKSNVTVDRKSGTAKPLVGRPFPSTALYNLQSLQRDADRDGIMCER